MVKMKMFTHFLRVEFIQATLEGDEVHVRTASGKNIYPLQTDLEQFVEVVKCSECGKEAPPEPNNIGSNCGPLPKDWHDVFRILRFEPNFRRAMEKAAMEEREPQPMCDECYKSKPWMAASDSAEAAIQRQRPGDGW